MYPSCIIQSFVNLEFCVFLFFLEYNHLLAVKHNLLELYLK
jgi:hypothetical protein